MRVPLSTNLDSPETSHLIYIIYRKQIIFAAPGELHFWKRRVVLHTQRAKDTQTISLQVKCLSPEFDSIIKSNYVERDCKKWQFKAYINFLASRSYFNAHHLESALVNKFI